ncbi:MAG: phosphatidate cytidylyltransferase [Dysgonamonadaceae bacterium]|nr:phosphatidate cytidylyltransferase [Dysgonamonadaceae bacterium]
MNIKNLLTRTGTGIIYILIIFAGIFGGKYLFIAVFGLITFRALFEFYRMVEKSTEYAISKAFNIVSGAVIFGTVYLYLEGICVYALRAFLLAYVLVLFVSAIFFKRGNILNNVIYSAFGQIYITLPISMLMLISYRYNTTLDNFHFVFIFAIFLFIWINDTAAYLVGSLLGRHKLIERISPKKTVEGFIGGIAFCVGAALLFARFFPEYPAWFWIVFGLITALFGTVGDLFESLIKRSYDVKDSGHIIPGHGGVLDRIDSLLVAIPAVYLYLMLVPNF